MHALELARLELKRFFRSRLTRAALVALLLLPLLYGALYLWAFWDPYGQLDKVPVALVNADRPVQTGGQQVDAGAKLERTLLERRVFDWQVVDQRTAAEGVRSGRYYLSLTIPADFSADLASPDAANPTAGLLEVETNDATNYLAGQISRSVFSEIRSATARGAIKGYFDKVFVSFGDIHAKTLQAAQGAGKLAGGAETLHSGTGKLAAGVGTAGTGARELAAGLAQLDSGAAQLSDGARKLAAGNGKLAAAVDPRADKLEPALRANAQKIQQRATQVAAAARLVAANVGKLPTLSGTALQRSKEADAALRKLVADAKVPPEVAAPALAASARVVQDAAKVDTAVRANQPKLAEIEREAAAVSALATRVAAEVPTLADRVRAARSQIDQLAAGAAQVAAGAAELSAGTGTALSGAQQLSAGFGKLQSGADQVDSGASKLAGGSHQLSDQLAAGAKKIPAYDKPQRDSRAGMMSEPVQLAKEELNPVRNYGTGFAPYFIPLALWVGSMFCFMLLRPVGNRALSSTAPPWRVALAGWYPAAGIGVLQVLALLTVLHYAVGLEMEHPVGTFAFLALTALAFTAVLQWVHAKFGVVGRLISLVLLMVQLTSAGGTYPVETSPGFFQTLHPYLPMTYVVEGLRHLISGGPMTSVWHAAAVLAAFLAGGLALSSLTARKMRVWSLRRLHPELVV